MAGLPERGSGARHRLADGGVYGVRRGTEDTTSAAKIDWTEETIGPIRRQLYDVKGLIGAACGLARSSAGEAYWRGMGLGAQEGGGACDGQGEAHHREGHDHIESPVQQDRHFLSPSSAGSGRSGPHVHFIWTTFR